MCVNVCDSSKQRVENHQHCVCALAGSKTRPEPTTPTDHTNTQRTRGGLVFALCDLRGFGACVARLAFRTFGAFGAAVLEVLQLALAKLLGAQGEGMRAMNGKTKKDERERKYEIYIEG